ncbi:ABC transporter permease [Frondihabitans sp. PAMC 28766]|uniref:ABC transporter permease n=1 Tax=Frondihabitans sp. PAMC 28766 TaxID=1795630 RepID=UPI0012FF93FF|nr:ABC transporter permease [Frondihabitans sp. PAMC 28766]
MHQDVDKAGQRVWLNTLLSKYAVVAVAILLIIVFAVLNSSTFLTGANLQLILGGNSVALILALAGLLPLLAGEFDLSIGYTLELSAVVTAVLANDGVPLPLTLLIVLVMGAVIGLVNSFFITILGVSSFISTLGMGTVVSAISLELTHGEILIKNIPPALINFAQGTVGGVPLILIPAIVLFILFYIIGEHTTYGRRLLAVGLSPRASQLAGVRIGRSVGSTFVIAGVLAALAGWLELGRVGSASAGIGPNFLLPAITAGFLGATTIKTGRFNVLGTGVAVALVAVGIDGLQLNGAAYWVQPLFDGGVLLLAVGTAQLLARRAK